MNKFVREMIGLSRSLGKDPLLVQAGGGNVSAKWDGRMAIKTSGVRLGDVTAGRGWGMADREMILRGLAALARMKSRASQERGYAALLGRAGQTSGRRISMEAGFHALLPSRFVAHVHSAAGILLGLMPEKRAARLLAEKLGPDVSIKFIPPDTPGFAIISKIRRNMAGADPLPVGKTRLWILKNHGIIWEADSAEDILRASRRFEKIFRGMFHLDRYRAPHRPGAADCLQRGAAFRSMEVSGPVRQELCFCRWSNYRFERRPFFPDFAVYFDLWFSREPDLTPIGRTQVILGAKDAAALRDKREVLHIQTLAASASRVWGNRAMPLSAVAAIKGLETERHRMKQMARP